METAESEKDVQNELRVTVSNLAEIRRYISFAYKGHISGFANEIRETYHAVENVLRGRSFTVRVLYKICKELEIDREGVEEWKNRVIPEYAEWAGEAVKKDTKEGAETHDKRK